MASLVQYGKYGAINTTDTSAMVYYAIKFVLEESTLQEYTACDGQIISDGEIFVKAQYLSCMKENTNSYWESEKSTTSNYLSNTDYCSYMS